MAEEGLGKAVLYLETDHSGLETGLKKGERTTNQWVTSVSNSLSRGLKTALTVAAGLLATIGGAVVGLTAKAIDQGADAGEMLSKFQVTFGNATDETAQSLDAFAEASGRSRYELAGMAADMGAVLKGMGLQETSAANLSSEMAQLAVDVGSFNNVQSGEVQQRFISALTGEYESLKALGIVLNAAMVDQELLNMGIEGGAKAATNAELAQARYNLILQSTADAQGDAERTADSFSNQMVSLKALLGDLVTQMGVQLMPVAEHLLKRLSSLAADTLPQLAERLTDWLIPALMDAAELFFNLVDGVQSAAQFLSQFDMATLGATVAVVGLVALGARIWSMVTAVGGLTGAMAALNTAMLANPVIMVAAGIVAAGLAISKVVKQAKEDAAELAVAQEEAYREIARESESYEDYRQKIIALIRAKENLGETYSAEQIWHEELAKGTVIQAQNWESYSQILSGSVGPALQGTKDGMMNLRAELDLQKQQTAQAADGWLQMQQKMQASAAGMNAAMAEALQSDDVVQALEEMSERSTEILDDMSAGFVDITETAHDQMLDAQFQHNLARIQAEQAYLNEFNALMAAGRVDEANALTAKYQEQEQLASRDYTIQQQLQQRKILVQKVAQARAYVEELKLQAEQIREKLKNALLGAEAFLTLSHDEQVTLLSILYAGEEERLKAEQQTAQASVDVALASDKVQLESALETAKGILAAKQFQIGTAGDYLAELENKLANFEIELPPLPEFNLGGTLKSVSSSAVSAATDPATRALGDVADDLTDSILAIKRALQELPGLEVGEGVFEGLARMGEFVKEAVAEVYSWFEDPEADLEDRLKAVHESLQPLGDLLQLINTDLSRVGGVDIEGGFGAAAGRTVQQLRHLTGRLFDWMEEIPPETRELVKEAALVAKDVAQFYQLIGPDLAKVVAARPEGGFGANAGAYVQQLRHLTGRLYNWMQEIPEETRALVAEAAKVVDDVAAFYKLLGPDLAKVVPATPEGGFGANAGAYVQQLRHLTGRLYDWMQEIPEETRELVEKAALVAADVAEFYKLIGPDLEKIKPVDLYGGFGANAEAYVKQLRHLAGRLYNWMMEIPEETRPLVEEAAKVATNIKALFDVLDVNLDVETPSPLFLSQLTLFLDALKAAAPLLRTKLNEVAAEWASTEELAKSVNLSQQLQSFFSILDLAKTFREMEVQTKLGKDQYRTALSNVVTHFLGDLKTITPILKEGLEEVDAMWEGSLDTAIAIADKISRLYSAIADALQAGKQAREDSASVGVEHLLGVVRKLKQVYEELATIPMPGVPIFGVPDLPAPSTGLGTDSAGMDLVSMLDGFADRLGQQIVDGMRVFVDEGHSILDVNVTVNGQSRGRLTQRLAESRRTSINVARS